MENLFEKIKLVIIVILEYTYLIAKGMTPAIVAASYFHITETPVSKIMAFLIILALLGGVVHELILRKKE